MKKTLLSLSAAALLLAACGKKEQPAPAAEGQVAGTVQATETGKAAGAYEKKDTYFRLPAAAGGELDLAAYAGKPVLVMFFTETCPYCRKAAPAIESLHKKYGAKGLNTLGVCIQEEPQAALDFGKSLGVTFPLAYKGRAAYKNYKAQGVPYIYLLDGRHVINNVWEGFDDSYEPEMVKSIEAVLGGK